MTDTMINDIKQITFSVLEKQQEILESLSDFCSDIKTQMESKHSGHWQCIVFAQIGNFSLYYASGKYITYKIGDLTITVFAASQLNIDLNTISQRFRNGEIKREISIIRTGMDETMVNDVKEITFCVLNKQLKESESLSSEVVKQMESKHCGQWQCFAFVRDGNFTLYNPSDKFIHYKIDQIFITVFQTTN